jgi:glycosyltransferase XagB
LIARILEIIHGWFSEKAPLAARVIAFPNNARASGLSCADLPARRLLMLCFGGFSVPILSTPLEKPGEPEGAHSGPLPGSIDFRSVDSARPSTRCNSAIGLAGISRQSVYDAVEKYFRDELLAAAVCGLERKEPQFSARRVLTKRQRVFFAALFGSVALALVLAPIAFGTVFIGVLSVWFAVNALFRALLVWIGASETHAEALPLPAGKLPIYSILVPLYREANVLPALIDALRALDYPSDRIDAKLIVEADDAETIAALDELDLDARFHVIRVPPSLPRTKPKACNYALPFAHGEFVVIYDAEDRPEIDQLRKAVSAFRTMPPEVACLQARLNFYNANENWLTCMFALDYGLWFDFLLPGLDRMRIPMPLGGTSNHFRSEALRAIHGWDPFNVTEDADIGIRLARHGFRVHTLDSTTFEEATTSFGNWLRQRSRWQKGYIQTWLVHMRHPMQLLGNAGFRGFLGFQLFVGGTFVSALLNPILWAFVLFASLLVRQHSDPPTSASAVSSSATASSFIWPCLDPVAVAGSNLRRTA